MMEDRNQFTKLPNKRLGFESSSQSTKLSSQRVSSLSWLRALTLRQWRHAGPVLDPARNISHAGDNLHHILEELGAHNGLQEKQLQEAWKTIAGEFIASNAKPESLKKGVLILRVVQPTLKFELEGMKKKLLHNFHKEFGKDLVKTIILRI